MDVARDAMRLMRLNKSMAEIQTYMNHEYGKFGPPTSTETVEQ
ncbi:MAG: hypothetical protein ACFFA6_14425 [Promethearchaeota archaeon]